MQRLKDQGLDPTNPLFSDATPKPTGLVAPPQTIVMTKPDINRKISMEELAAHSTAENPWFVLHGEVSSFPSDLSAPLLTMYRFTMRRNTLTIIQEALSRSLS